MLAQSRVCRGSARAAWYRVMSPPGTFSGFNVATRLTSSRGSILSDTLTPMGFCTPRMNSTCALSSWRVRSPHHRKWAEQSYLGAKGNVGGGKVGVEGVSSGREVWGPAAKGTVSLMHGGYHASERSMCAGRGSDPPILPDRQAGQARGRGSAAREGAALPTRSTCKKWLCLNTPLCSTTARLASQDASISKRASAANPLASTRRWLVLTWVW